VGVFLWFCWFGLAWKNFNKGVEANEWNEEASIVLWDN